MPSRPVKWIGVDTESFPDAVCHDNLARVVFIIRFNAKMVDPMAKVMRLSIRSKVGNQIVRMQRVRLIRTSRIQL